MTTFEYKTIPFAAGGNSLAIAISGTSAASGQRHLTFLYSIESGIKQLHLAWHNKLNYHPWSGAYQWYEFEGLNPILQQTIAENLEAIARVNSHNDENMEEETISYSAIYNDDLTYFDEGFKYVNNGLGTGLTCATFVIAVLKRLGIPILKTETWPQRRIMDAKWLDYILIKLEELIKKYPNIKLHTSAQRKYKNLLRRYRPEEVAAAPCLYKGIPLTFKQIEPTSKDVLSRLPKKS